MPFQKTRAIVLRKIDFSETSQVLHLLTADYGKIAGIAKGAKRRKSGFSGPFDYFAMYEIVFIDKHAGSMDILTASEVMESYRDVIKDYETYTLACYVAEFLDRLVADGQQIKGMFDTAVHGWRDLNARQLPSVTVMRFETQALRLLGFLPRTETCCLCNAKVDAYESVHFSARHGGALCPRCPGTDPTRIVVRTPALAALNSLAHTTNGDAHAMDWSEPLHGELRRLLTYYTTYLMERPPRTKV